MSDTGSIRVAVSGALGKMGQAVVKTVLGHPQLTLVAAIDTKPSSTDVALTVGHSAPCGVVVSTDLARSLQESQAQVCVDFTHPDAILNNALTIIQAGCRPVIGTTGLSEHNLSQIQEALTHHHLGGAVIPNFAIGAVLMMKFAQEAAQYFESAEIIELHHNRKADAPSGTALKTAELMAESRTHFQGSLVSEKETLPGARGAKGPGDIPIHSVRLPSLVAHQEVLLAGPGQLLTLRHDSFDRESFMPGVALAVQKVMNLQGLVYGLEHLL